MMAGMDENPYKSPESTNDLPPDCFAVVPIRRTAARGALWGASSFAVVMIATSLWINSDTSSRGFGPVALLVVVLKSTAFGAVFGAVVGALSQAMVNLVRR